MKIRSATWSDPRLRWAIALAVLFHGALLFAGSYRGTYDAWVHIFFGDHYARSWFDTWEPRWYTGFTVTSYPPASHQAIGLLSAIVGLETGFVLVQLAAVVLVVVGVYRFSLLWVSRPAAGWAALLAVVSSSIAEVVHTFGQLPTTFALGWLLNAQPSIRRWIRDGVRVDLLVAVALLAATTAGHHVTVLFGSVFFTGPVVVRALLDRWATPVDGEPPGHRAVLSRSTWWPHVTRRARRVLPSLTRTAVLGGATLATLLIVVLPYWLWSSSDPIAQVPIPHASRDSFLDDRTAGLVFWLVPWASLLVLTPLALVRAVVGRGWPIAASVGLLGLLGTGGTTPVPRALLGGAYEILTLDRFTVWATIAVLPFAGWAIQSLRVGRLRSLLSNQLGRWAPRAVLGTAIALAVASTVFAATLTAHRPFQPREIDPDPIAAFMAKDQHERWRYLTLGFGDQMAWVAANTTALTVDGNYHSARRLPELTTRPVERLEGAKFRGIPGLGSLQQFLTNPSPYHLKFVFSIDRFYDPLLWATGWQRIGTLINDVEVWERADVPPLPDVLPAREIPGWQRLMWGILPLTSVAAGLVALGWLTVGRPLPARWSALGRPSPGLGRLPRPVDRRLARAARRLGPGGPRQPWSPLDRASRRVRAALDAPVSRRRRTLHAALVLGLAAVPIVLAVGRQAGPNGPVATVEAYYDALDLRDFERAHDLLDPDSRPDLDQYLLDLSLRDGLLDGYGELDAVVVEARRIDADRAVADAELVYVTAVEEYRVERSHRLIRRSGSWFVVPEASSSVTPPDQLVVRPAVVVSTLGRREATTATTSFSDVLDRPRLALGPTTVYRDGAGWTVVGDVTNIDVDPADVTVASTLRSASGAPLAAYDAGPSTIHQVLPGETVAFRIDVEGRAGSVDPDDPVAGDFDPTAYSLPVLDSEVASVDVASRAVVTGGQLQRTIGLYDVSIDPVEKASGSGPALIAARVDPATLQFAATLRNDGTEVATVPRVTVTYLDEDGAVVWVDHHWVSAAIRPQRALEVAWTSELPDPVRTDVVIDSFDNNKVDGEEGVRSGVLDGFPVDGVEISGRAIAGVRLDVTSFHRGEAR